MSKKITDKEIEIRLDAYNETLDFLTGPHWETKEEEKQAEIVYNQVLNLLNCFRRKYIHRIKPL
jgi:hypothetical protein